MRVLSNTINGYYASSLEQLLGAGVIDTGEQGQLSSVIGIGDAEAIAGLDGKKLLHARIGWLADGSKTVRGYELAQYLRQLGEIGPDAREAAWVVARGLNNSDYFVKGAAIGAAGSIGAYMFVKPLIEIAYGSSHMEGSADYIAAKNALKELHMREAFDALLTHGDVGLISRKTITTLLNDGEISVAEAIGWLDREFVGNEDKLAEAIAATDIPIAAKVVDAINAPYDEAKVVKLQSLFKILKGRFAEIWMDAPLRARALQAAERVFNDSGVHRAVRLDAFKLIADFAERVDKKLEYVRRGLDETDRLIQTQAAEWLESIIRSNEGDERAVQILADVFVNGSSYLFGAVSRRSLLGNLNAVAIFNKMRGTRLAPERIAQTLEIIGGHPLIKREAGALLFGRLDECKSPDEFQAFRLAIRVAFSGRTAELVSMLARASHSPKTDVRSFAAGELANLLAKELIKENGDTSAVGSALKGILDNPREEPAIRGIAMDALKALRDKRTAFTFRFPGGEAL
jgi:hypothetical protein